MSQNKLIEAYNAKTPDQKKVILLSMLMIGVIVMLIGLTVKYNTLVSDYNDLLPEVNRYRTSICFPEANYAEIVEQICSGIEPDAIE